ncbi:DUF3047 domain-containing protein [Roseateles sp. BYS180W]|uniref:DUF3047 domain-containing protein n=1 Tax=Roseateles rivi TaxID=3299028 RepID=A0ABW7FX20_9BURK
MKPCSCVLTLAAALWLCGCAHLPGTGPDTGLGPRTAAVGFPPGWHHLPIRPGKALTQYRWVEGEVIHADATHSASMLLHEARGVDLARTPLLAWQWKLAELPEGAQHHVAAREDAAARIVLLFDGDKTQLPLEDRMALAMAEAISGRPMPYATLMYVSSSSAEPEALIPNPHSGRVQKIVVSRDSQALGQWLSLQRDVRADYERAFGHAPGRLIAYGVMSDADNTYSEAEAWFRALRFVKP